jgi:Uma2 family endonuclease
MGMAIAVPRYKIEELERLPNDGNRYELLDGVLLVTPAPALIHQRVANRLQFRLTAGVEVPGLAHVVGPGVLISPPGTQLQPDLLVYPAVFPPGAEWLDITQHWLAVEILSRSSRVYDREFKRDAYFALGVQQVWLVDWRDGSVEQCRSRGVSETVRDVIRWRVPAGDHVVPIELNEIFTGLG